MASPQAPPEEALTPVPTTEQDEEVEIAVGIEGDGEAEGGAEVSTAKDNGKASDVKDEEWAEMQKVLKAVYDHRSADGHDTSRLFQKNVNKRNLPDYYDVIKEPMALSVLKKKINAKEYREFKGFVRDCALITYNAQVYNRANSGAYQDALEIKQVVEAELARLVESGLISKETAAPPFLGEIPIQEDPVPEEEEEEEEEDDEEEQEQEQEEEDDGAASDDSRKPRVGKKRGRKRKEQKEEEGTRDGWKKKRGRPPKVDTPMEGRIKNVLKGLRRHKMQSGELRIFSFDRLPDKVAVPDYYQEIKQPMAIDVIKKKLKRKKYTSVQQFAQDIDLIFDNAKEFNQDGSQIYQDAVLLQADAKTLVALECDKPDSAFAMEDGRLPLPEGIIHKGELYKVGDWVHLVNPNDLTKPIVVQIYRTWQDGAGQKFINACWYYRPEQTVHRFDRHFFENEIVKTGQYRDHAVDEIIDRCFVMFITRFTKGRPRNIAADKEIYVCESRYNEEKHSFNKIKTWASCLPDEVRDKDYEMEMFPVPKKIKKQPSPIAYLLKDEQKETDDLPKPEWGADNAPPKIGAAHRRPRDPKDSPPPEPTPSPPPREPTPPPPPPKPVVPVAQMNGLPPLQHSASMNFNTPSQARPLPPMTMAHQSVQQQYQRQQKPQSPAPPFPRAISSTSQQNGYHSAHTPSYQTQYQRPPQPSSGYQQHNQHQQNYSQQQPIQPRYQPQNSYTATGNYKAPHPVEVYHLSEPANASIPADIRAQFQTDDQGHVLFFTAPPLNTISAGEEKERSLQGHSVRYLAAKVKRDQLVAEKRKRDAEEDVQETERKAKAAKVEAERHSQIKKQRDESAMRLLEGVLYSGCEQTYRGLYGDERWKEEMEKSVEGVSAVGPH